MSSNEKRDESMIEEVFKDIKGLEGKYRVSNLGRIYSVKRRMYLKLSLNSHGYRHTTIAGKVYRIHRLVAETFVDRKYGKDVVNHINGIKTDNRASNLEWCTSKENSVHFFSTHKDFRENLKLRSRDLLAKLTEEQIREIHDLSGKFTGVALAKKYGVSPQNISYILSGKSWPYLHPKYSNELQDRKVEE